MLVGVARSYREDRLARARRGDDDGSPTRAVGSMVALVAVLLLGSLFWSALTSVAGAVTSVAAQLPDDPLARSAPTSQALLPASPAPAAEPAATSTAAPTVASTAAAAASAPAAAPSASAATPTPAAAVARLAPAAATPLAAAAGSQAPAATSAPTVAAVSTAANAAAEGRAPWVLLPAPAAGAAVHAGAIVVSARGRGDAPLAAMRLELDGVALPAQVEQRSDTLWLAQASTTVDVGPHAARALVTDTAGRVGGYRWTFTVAP